MAKKQMILRVLAMYAFMRNIIESNAIIEVSSGIYLERLPNVSFYQTTRQVIFRVHKPQSILDKLKCRENFCMQYAYLCNLMSKNFDYFSYIMPNGGQHVNYDDPILSDDGELFDYQLVTRNHVPRTFSSDQEITILMQRLMKREHLNIYEIEFPNAVKKAITNLTCNDPNLFNLIQLEIILQYETSRNFVNMCQSKKLQLDIVPMDKLVAILSIINKEIDKNDYVIALNSYSNLYMMPLVECMMSKNTALVGLHIPLLRKQFQGMQMKKVLTPSYAWQNYTCTVDIPPLTVALVKDTSEWRILVPNCEPLKDEMCFISDTYNTESLGISCIRQLLLGGSFNQFSSICPVSCRETGNDNQFLTQLSSHKVLVTHPKPSLQLRCSDNTYPLKVHQDIGNLMVTVPCHCYFTDNNATNYPRYLCVDQDLKFSQQQIIPAVWTKFGGLTLAPMGSTILQFDHLEDCINEEWIQLNYDENPIPTSTYFVMVNFFLILIIIITFTYLYYTIKHSVTQICNSSVPQLSMNPRKRHTNKI